MTTPTVIKPRREVNAIVGRPAAGSRPPARRLLERVSQT
jgi:hypothetical protein